MLRAFVSRSRQRVRSKFGMESLEDRHLLAADPIISEFLARNGDALEDGDQESPDWIEIFNAGDEAINLQGWHLTDNAEDLGQWTFPNTSLAAGEYLVVFASGKDFVDVAGNLHTNFSLSGAGEYVALSTPTGQVASEFELGGNDYPDQRRDVSYGVAQPFVDTNLVGAGAEASVLVPTVGNGGSTLGNAWKGGSEPFNDAAWLHEIAPGVPVTTGVGMGAIGPEIAVAGELYVDLDAADASAGTETWLNRGTLGNFAEQGDAVRSTVSGVPAVTFDGMDDWYQGPAAPVGITGANATTTVELWVYNPSLGSEESMVAWGTRGGAAGGNSSFNYGTSATAGAVSHNSAADYGWPVVPEAGKWQYLVYTFDGTTTRIYQDGARVGSEAVTAGQVNPVANLPILLAAQRATDGSAAQLGSLSIGKVRVHNGVLTEPQITNNFALERTSFFEVAPGSEIEPPVHRYSFTDGDVGVVDSIGGANGTLVNGAAVSGNALQLDGVNDHVTLPASQLAIGSLTAVSLEFWATMDPATAARARVFDFGTPANLANSYLYFSPDGGLGGARAGITNASGLGQEQAITYPLTLDTGTQQHVALVVDDPNNLMKLFVDGNKVAEATVTHPLSVVSNGAAYLGRSIFGLQQFQQFLKGSIDEFRIYDYALSDDQVKGNSTAGPNVLNTFLGDGGIDEAPVAASASRLVSTDIEAQLLGVNSSAFVRIPFEVANPDTYELLTLRMAFDDGFVAYLNGVEIARENAPGTVGGNVAYNATATSARPDDSETTIKEFNVTPFLSSLRAGTNILAIQGLNLTAADDDFLVHPELIGTDLQTSVHGFFDPPTPGEANGDAVVGFVADTRFSVDRGFFENPFDVVIATNTPGATIVYTTDGSVPTLSNGTLVGPANDTSLNSVTVHIPRTTVLRAAAFKDGYGSTNTDTQSYLFLDDVVNQTTANVIARGFPTTWGGNVVDYEVDPDIATNTASTYYEPTLKDDLQTIPSISLVIPNEDFFGAQRGVYANASQRGDLWERATSVELLDPNNPNNVFQVDAGLRAAGGVGRAASTPRHSMRLVFNDDYGPGTFEYPLFGDSDVTRFNGLYLRGGWNYTWTGDSGGNTQRSQYLRDQFGRDSVLDMGGLAAHGYHVNLYINGLYWGLYNLHERPDSVFAEEYLGPSEDGYDILKTPAEQFSNVTLEINSGDRVAWDQLFALAETDLSDPANYENISKLVDIPALVDYMLTVIYTGSRDSPVLIGNDVEPRNFWVMRKREEGSGFIFIPWDFEWSIEDVNVNRVNVVGDENPHRLFQRLKANEEFRLLVQDRIQEEFYNDGVFTPQVAAARYMERADAIDRAIVGESARWGDQLRANQPYTRDLEWITEQNRLLNSWFPQRTNIVLQQLRDAGWFPVIPGPAYTLNGTLQHGGPAEAGDNVKVVIPAGEINVDTEILPVGAPVRVFVPTNDSLGTSWTTLGFDDSTWVSGVTGVGYENGAGYEAVIDPTIGSYLLSNMFSQYSTALMRIEFDFDDRTQLEGLILSMSYDDGFVAYLNGVEVARSSTVTPGAITFTTLAANHDDAAALAFEEFDITSFADLLVDGTNLLSIVGINQALDSSDFLIRPKLVERTVETVSAAVPIYVTTDGSDPRLPDGSISPSAQVFGAQATTLVTQNDPVRVLIPSTTNGGSTLGTTWAGGNEPFNAAAWATGNGPIAYDNGAGPSTIQVAGQLYVDLDARDASAGTATWVNDGSLGDFTRSGSPTLGTFGTTTQPGVNFQAANDHFLGPASVADLVGASDRSIEVWAFNPSVGEQNGEETMVSWGRRGGPDGTNMGFNYGNSTLWGAVTHWGGNGPDMPWQGGVPQTGTWHHLVYVFDGGSVARVYSDGVLNYQETVSLNTHAGFPILLSAQNTDTGRDFAQSYLGVIGAVRVHGGALTESQILNNYLVDAARFGAGQVDYDQVAGLDIEAAMFNKNSSAFVRIPFEVDVDSEFDELVLRVKYDDGFVAYLNGVEVARRNAPASVAWNSVAAADRTDTEALTFETIDISSFVGELVPGATNILALQGLNESASSPRFLLGAELEAATRVVSQITLDQTTQLKARTRINGAWGPVTDTTFIVTPPVGVQGIVISEVHYHPADPSAAEEAAIPGVTGDDFEFIEVYNAHPTDTINLLGMSLVDGVTFSFPNVGLAPGEYAIVVEDAIAFQQRYGASDLVVGEWSGGLSNNGETIALNDALGNPIVVVTYNDVDPWAVRADGVGASLELINPANTPATEYNQANRWRGSTAFHGSPGSSGAAPIGVVINEVFSATDPPVAHADSIELHNPTSVPINIGGWYLSDSGTNALKYRIAVGTVLDPGAYIVFDESDFNPNPTSPGLNDFALSGTSGDDVWLVQPNGSGGIAAFVDDVHFGPAENGVSFGRVPNGGGVLVPNTRVTLGCENSYAVAGSVVISEVHYLPTEPTPAAVAAYANITAADLEYVELVNPTNATVTLTDWRVRGGIDYDFDAGTTLAAGEVALLISFNPTDPLNADRVAAFRTHYGLSASVRLLGGFANRLSDDGERVQLQRPGTPDPLAPTTIPRLYADEIRYDDIAPWDVVVAGNSLQRQAPVFYGNAASSWQSGAATPGIVSFAGGLTGDLDNSGVVDSRDVDFVFDLARASSNILYADLNGDSVVNSGDANYLVQNILGSRMGDANLDGSVDASDFNLWNQAKFSPCGTMWSQGDFNGDGATDGSDFNIWLANRFTSGTAAGPSHATPRAALAVVGGDKLAEVSRAKDFVLAVFDSGHDRSTLRMRDAFDLAADNGDGSIAVVRAREEIRQARRVSIANRLRRDISSSADSVEKADRYADSVDRVLAEFRVAF